MAYTQNSTQKVVALIRKNQRGDYIQISRITPENASKAGSIDIRSMWTTPDDEIAPSKQGVRINSELIPEVMSALLEAMSSEELADLLPEIERITRQVLGDDEEYEDDEDEGGNDTDEE